MLAEVPSLLLRLSRRWFGLHWTVALLLVLNAAPPATAEPSAQQALHAMFDARWQQLMRTHPEWATYSGDHRHGDRLHDASAAAQ